MTKVLPFSQEACGACATQREKNEGSEDAPLGIQSRQVDMQSIYRTITRAVVTEL